MTWRYVTMRKLTMIVVMVMMSVLLMNMNALAGGGQQYPNGAEDIYCAACPPPGWWAVSYTFYKDVDKLTDASPVGGDIDLDDAYVFAEVVRVIYSSENTFLGGRHLAHAFFQYVDVDLDLGAPGIIDNDNGFGNIIFNPCILTWVNGPIHYTAGMDIYIPVGEHEDDQLVNPGKDFWTFEPIFAVTGIFDKLSFSAKFMYDFSTETDEQVVAPGVVGNLQPGQEFHFDYAADYAINGGLRAGVNGYYYKQMCDDEIDGVDSTADKSEAFAIGPVAKYDFMLAGNRASLIGKVLFDVNTTSWSEGDSYWMKFVYNF
jgi:hypothetical protein